MKLRLLLLLLLPPYVGFYSEQSVASETEDYLAGTSRPCGHPSFYLETNVSHLPPISSLQSDEKHFFLPPISHLKNTSPGTPYSPPPSISFLVEERSLDFDVSKTLLSLQFLPPPNAPISQGRRVIKNTKKKKEKSNKIVVSAMHYIEVMHLSQPEALEKLVDQCGQNISISTLKRRYYDPGTHQEIKDLLLTEIPEPLEKQIGPKFLEAFKNKLCQPGRLRWPHHSASSKKEKSLESPANIDSK